MKNIDDIIIQNESLIYSIINKYKNYFELDDLYQVAVLGMIKAYNKYDNKMNVKFTSYAYLYVLGEVIKYVNEYRSIKLNKDSRKLYFKILKARDILSQKLMKVPSVSELALFLELDESVIDEVLMSNMAVDSLDKIIIDEGKTLDFYSKIGYEDGNMENYHLKYEIEKLNEEERKIIKGRYYEDMSQKEVGNVLGMYQVEVSRKEKKILKKLKDKIAV